MDDEKFRRIFENFEPEGAVSDARFIESLEKGLDAVDDIKKMTEAHSARARRAAVTASIAGFAAGVLATLLFQWIAPGLNAAATASIAGFVSDMVGYMFISCATLASAFITYSFFFFTEKPNRPSHSPAR